MEKILLMLAVECPKEKGNLVLIADCEKCSFFGGYVSKIFNGKSGAIMCEYDDRKSEWE